MNNLWKFKSLKWLAQKLMNRQTGNSLTYYLNLNKISCQLLKVEKNKMIVLKEKLKKQSQQANTSNKTKIIYTWILNIRNIPIKICIQFSKLSKVSLKKDKKKQIMIKEYLKNLNNNLMRMIKKS